MLIIFIDSYCQIYHLYIITCGVRLQPHRMGHGQHLKLNMDMDWDMNDEIIS